MITCCTSAWVRSGKPADCKYSGAQSKCGGRAIKGGFRRTIGENIDDYERTLLGFLATFDDSGLAAQVAPQGSATFSLAPSSKMAKNLNVRWKPPFIARRTVHRGAPLQLGVIRRWMLWPRRARGKDWLGRLPPDGLSCHADMACPQPAT